MTQALHVKPEHKLSSTPSLGAAAAAAATTTPSSATPTSDTPKPAVSPRRKASDMTEAEKAVAKAERLAKAQKIFIVVGTIHEFETAAKAEKFLNGAGDVPAPGEYAVLRGKRIGTSKKVSLR